MNTAIIGLRFTREEYNRVRVPDKPVRNSYKLVTNVLVNRLDKGIVYTDDRYLRMVKGGKTWEICLGTSWGGCV